MAASSREDLIEITAVSISGDEMPIFVPPTNVVEQVQFELWKAIGLPFGEYPILIQEGKDVDPNMVITEIASTRFDYLVETILSDVAHFERQLSQYGIRRWFLFDTLLNQQNHFRALFTMPYLRNLTHINLKEFEMNRAFVCLAASSLVDSTIRSVIFSENTQYDDVSATALAEALPNTELYHLNLGQTNLSSEIVSIILKGCSKSSISKLVLNTSDVQQLIDFIDTPGVHMISIFKYATFGDTFLRDELINKSNDRYKLMCAYNEFPTIEKLASIVEAGININVITEGRKPFLHRAVEVGAIDVAAELLRRGANPNFVDYVFGKTPIEYSESEEITALLLQYINAF